MEASHGKQQIIRCLRIYENAIVVTMSLAMLDLGLVVVQGHMQNEEDTEEEAVRIMAFAEGM